MEVPKDLKYTQEHEWIRIDGKKAVVGITEFAQEQLGDIVFVELPEVGSEIEQESPAPVSGKVTAVNKDLETNPEKVNSEPYGGGWVVEIELSNEKDIESLLDADAYTEQCQKETE